MTEHLIKIKNLNKSYKYNDLNFLVLDNTYLEIKEGDIISIIGPSGVGKTTLLNAIAGFIEPDLGEILLKGNKIQGPGPDRAVVFQDDAVFPWMNVEDNISYSHRVTNKYNEEAKNLVDKYINLVGLQDFKKAWPKQLSGGMRKRVDLARGYAANPEL